MGHRQNMKIFIIMVFSIVAVFFGGGKGQTIPEIN